MNASSYPVAAFQPDLAAGSVHRKSTSPAVPVATGDDHGSGQGEEAAPLSHPPAGGGVEPGAFLPSTRPAVSAAGRFFGRAA